MSTTDLEVADGVPFSFFVSLLREISKVSPHKVKNNPRKKNYQDYPVKSIFTRWANHLREKFSPLPSGTTSIVFRLLFPHEDTRRKYDMQEQRLASAMAKALGIHPDKLRDWSTSGTSGCLGQEIEQILEKTCPIVGGHISPLSIARVDELLDELAALSGYTHSSIRSKYSTGQRRTRVSILRSLFHTLSPLDACFLIQIILKDLRPVLYPLQDSQLHYTSALLDYNTKAIKMLSEQDALQVWDPSGWMLKMYRVRSTLQEVTEEFEKPTDSREIPGPRLGTMVTLPKSEKGRSPRHALKMLSASSSIWAETKYDGERAQIHVEILQPGSRPKITIFSKSKRDSTLDRKGVHEVVLSALGLHKMGRYMRDDCKIKTGIILDAEMVACNGNSIDEFWRIRGLIERSAYGIRRNSMAVVPESQSQSFNGEESQLSMLTANIENRHLGMVFFDVLQLNGHSLLSTPYSKRREILESLINVIPGEAMLSKRTLISLPPSAATTAARPKDPPEVLVAQLESAFAKCIGHAEEGLVLKAAESRYHDRKMPWVKLKRDYIPGYGDALDMVLVGATWERDRGRELRVGTDTFTTLYIGGIKPGARPHLHVYFTVSYGLNRRQLEELNFTIKSSEHYQVSRLTNHIREALPYTFDLYKGIQSPMILLHTPLLVELVGAGFTKSAGSCHYELRFPRIVKIHRPLERPWTSGTTQLDLHKIACAAVGRDPSKKAVRDSAAQIWGKQCSPGAKSSLKRKATTELWEERLAALDGRTWKRLDEMSGSEEELELPVIASKARPLQVVTNTPVKKQRVEVIDLCTPSPKTSRSNASVAIPLSSDPENISPPSSSQVKSSLMKNAVVWIAKAKGKAADRTSVSLQVLTSPAHRLHSFQSLLSTCGWQLGSAGGAWANIERGIILLESGWEDYVVGRLKDISGATMIENRKPIHVLDVFGEELYCFT